jgi:glutamyl-tRNA synthetase
MWFNKEYILMKDNSELAPEFDKILRANGIVATMEQVEAVVGMMKMKKINFIKELWPLCDFFFIAPETYSMEDKFVRKNWGETAAADMSELADLLESLTDFSVASQQTAVEKWVEETGKKPWNPWRVALVGTGKGPDMYELSAFLGKEETLRRLRKAIEILK